MTARSSILAALAAALLFGGSTPFAKLLVGDVSPILLAGLLYLGSGIGLWAVRLIHDRGFALVNLPTNDWPWLLGAIASGGVLGPVLLMYGLTQASAGSASLLLNLEAVFTAVMAWVVFRENADRRIVLGMVLIVAGGAVLAWPQGGRRSQRAVGRTGHRRSLSMLGAGQQPDPPGLRFGCGVHRRYKGPSSGCDELCAGARTGRSLASASRSGRRHGGRSGRIWRQPGALRAGIARTWLGTHRSLFFDSSVHGGGDRCFGIPRADDRNVLAGVGADGSGRLATPDRTSRARAYA